MTALNGTIVVTGGESPLGIATATTIATAHPLYHIVLTVADLTSTETRQAREKMRRVGPRSYECIQLDTNSFYDVATFAERVVESVRSQKIPPVLTLINAASYYSAVADKPTSDGFDPVYQTNCLTPFLLTISLLEAFDSSDARVLNIGGSSSLSHGSLDHFEKRPTRSAGTVLNSKEAMTRYASSILLMNAAMYALRRSLVQEGGISMNIMTIDIGKRSNLTGLGSLGRALQKFTVHRHEAVAEVIAVMAVQSSLGGRGGREEYYLMDHAVQLQSALRFTRDGRLMNQVLKQTMADIEMDLLEDCGRSSQPTLSSIADSEQ